jgi:REP element-mobilizing transposase RayT
MAHSYISSLYHVVFSTKERRRFLTMALQERLWPHLSGVARERGMRALAVGGVEDHVHILLSLPATLAIAYGTREEKRQTNWPNDSAMMSQQ